MKKTRGDYYSEDDCSLEEFITLLRKHTDPVACPNATAIELNVPIYDCESLTRDENPDNLRPLLSEWATMLDSGPGVIVLRNPFRETQVIDQATGIFNEIIADQHRFKQQGGDHFGKVGANERIWNALEKLCLKDPRTFAIYYSNPWIARIAKAWLGPNYQVTSQINVVNPGGEAQQVHRDYHLGFQTNEECSLYPTHVHHLTPFLTLQGAVAHSEMPIESGPTQLLPFSHQYGPGYLAWRLPEFRSYFEDHSIQLPLGKGDMIFFNPALFHGAGDNHTQDISRMANLLQISSPFGRAMESVNRTRMSIELYPSLKTLLAEGHLDHTGCKHAIAACAEGYPFPTNLDTDPPIGGLAPQSAQSIMIAALKANDTPESLVNELKANDRRRSP
jgi:ectoine hydroxylase-related dioxygenase (phytanoyl-CoA dioxygenase family)